MWEITFLFYVIDESKRETYQGWLEPLVNIDEILLLYGVAIFLRHACDIKLNRIIILTADPSIGNTSQHLMILCWVSMAIFFVEARLSKVKAFQRKRWLEKCR